MSERIFIVERFFRLQNRETLLAFFTFVDNETKLEYSNWRLLNGSNGPFVGSPSESYDHPQKGMQYYPYVRPAYDANEETKRSPKGDAFMKEVMEADFAFYESKSGGTTPAMAGANASGTGPVGTDEPDDGLPF